MVYPTIFVVRLSLVGSAGSPRKILERMWPICLRRPWENPGGTNSWTGLCIDYLYGSECYSYVGLGRSGVGFHLNGFPHDRMEGVVFAIEPI